MPARPVLASNPNTPRHDLIFLQWKKTMLAGGAANARRTASAAVAPGQIVVQ
jgi:hypothetical protein